MKDVLQELLITKNDYLIHELYQKDLSNIANTLKDFTYKEQATLIELFHTEQAVKIINHYSLEKQHLIFMHLSIDKSKTLINRQLVNNITSYF
ncbi:hypothetical protein [Bacillus cereus group sp. RP43]|uniref:hypothetical protein n=1 Tax=Bacillus cereus group sp. RP43 TaxID=3040260 RepID=UPI003397493A